MMISKNFIFSIIFTLLIWAGALASMPLGPVPLTFQTSAILLAALVLPMRYALFSVILYIILGLIGLPVFAGGRSGIEVLTGPTGGFIVGFVIAVVVVSYLSDKIRYNIIDKKIMTVYSQAAWPCLAGSIILQICGVIWGKIYSGEPWNIVYEQWMEPFYLNMVLKIIISVFVAVQIWKQASKKAPL